MIKRIPSALLLSLLVSTSLLAAKNVNSSFIHVDDSTIVVTDQKPIHNSFNNVKNVVILVLNQLDQKANNQLVDALTKQMINHFDQINVNMDRFKESKREPFVNYLATQLRIAYKSSISLNEQLAKAQKEREKDRLYILKIKKENKSADYKQILKEAQEALDNYDSEKYQAILKRFEEDKRFNEDRKNQANSHYLRGRDYVRNNNYKDAKTQFKIASGYDSEKGEYQLMYGMALHHLSEYDKALIIFKDVLSLFQASKDRENEGATLNNIAIIYKARGDLTTALTYLQQSLAIRQAIGDKSGEGATLNNISQIYDARGDLTTALTYLQQSLAIQQAIGDKSGEGATLNNIATIYKARGDLTTALTYLQQSLAIYQTIGDKSGEGVTLNNIATIYKARGDLPTALTYLQQSLAIYQAIGDKSGEGTTLNNIGYIHWANDDHDQATRNWVEAYRIAKKIEYAELLNALEGLAKQLGHEEGLGYWERLSRERP